MHPVLACRLVVALVHEEPAVGLPREDAEPLAFAPDLDGGGAASHLHGPLRPTVGDAVVPPLEGDETVPADFPRHLDVEGFRKRKRKGLQVRLFKVQLS
jgi:hypothetical protein